MPLPYRLRKIAPRTLAPSPKLEIPFTIGYAGPKLILVPRSFK